MLAVSALALDHNNAGETPQAGGAAAAAADPGQTLFVDEVRELSHAQRRRHHRHGRARTSTTSSRAPTRCIAAIENGGLGRGTMPTDIVIGAEAQQVADYVSKNAGK